MEKEEMLKLYDSIDIDKPLESIPNVYMGDIKDIRESFIQNNYPALTEKMYKLKQEIGGCDTSGKLNHIEELLINYPKPSRQNYNFGIENDNNVKMHEQAFYQTDLDWYNFLTYYKEYLGKNIMDKNEKTKINTSSKHYDYKNIDEFSQNVKDLFETFLQKFNIKFQNSQNKQLLLKKEINNIEKLFGIEKFYLEENIIPATEINNIKLPKSVFLNDDFILPLDLAFSIRGWYNNHYKNGNPIQFEIPDEIETTGQVWAAAYYSLLNTLKEKYKIANEDSSIIERIDELLNKRFRQLKYKGNIYSFDEINEQKFMQDIWFEDSYIIDLINLIQPEESLDDDFTNELKKECRKGNTDYFYSIRNLISIMYGHFLPVYKEYFLNKKGEERTEIFNEMQIFHMSYSKYKEVCKEKEYGIKFEPQELLYKLHAQFIGILVDIEDKVKLNYNKYIRVIKLQENNFIEEPTINIQTKEQSQKPKKETTLEKKKPKPQLLINIWVGDVKYYDEIINELKKVTERHDAYITEINEKLTWNFKKNKYQYLAAFVQTLIKNKWINDSYSATDYVRMLSNTFNLKKFDSNPFKSVSTRNIRKEYLIPFKNIRLNS